MNGDYCEHGSPPCEECKEAWMKQFQEMRAARERRHCQPVETRSLKSARDTHKESVE